MARAHVREAYEEISNLSHQKYLSHIKKFNTYAENSSMPQKGYAHYRRNGWKRERGKNIWKDWMQLVTETSSAYLNNWLCGNVYAYLHISTIIWRFFSFQVKRGNENVLGQQWVMEWAHRDEEFCCEVCCWCGWTNRCRTLQSLGVNHRCR